MNDAWGYSDPNEGQGNTHNDGPKALRDAYEAQKKMLEEMRAEMARDREERNRERLQTVFTTMGVPGAAEHYQGDPDPEKAKAWVQSMQGVFGTGSVLGDGPVNPAPVQPALAADQQEQFQRLSEAGTQGTPMGNFEAAASAVGQATDMASLIASFQNASRLNG